MRDIRPESLKGFERKIYNSFAPNFKLKQQLPVGPEIKKKLWNKTKGPNWLN